MVSLLATAVAFTACSDNDEPDPVPQPEPSVKEASVTLELGKVSDEAIEFTLTPVNAVKAAWVYFEDNGREVTAEQVLGCTSADPKGAQTLVAGPLTPGTEYVIYAAVEGEDGKAVLSEPLKAKTTGEVVEIEEFWAEAAQAEFFAANNWSLTLTDAEGNEATFDLYIESAGSDYLPSYEFTVADGTTPGTLRKNEYSYLKIGGETLAIEEGELFVEADLEETTEMGGVFYHIEGQLTAGGRLFSILFDGEVAGTKAAAEAVEIVISQAILTDIRDPQPGEFYVKLNNADWSYEIVFDFQAGAEAAYLPSNNYSLEWGTLLPKTSISGYYGNPTADVLTACEIDVMLENNIYHIDANAVGDNGTKFHIVYEGPIENMPEVVQLGQIYPQISWMDTSGMVVLADVPATNMELMMEEFTWCGSLFLETETSMDYLNGFFSGMPAESDGVIDFSNSVVMYRDTPGIEPAYGMIVPEKSWISVLSAMPDQDINEIAFQLVTMSDEETKIFVGSYQGPCYGGGISTEPIEYPLYGINEAELKAHDGNHYQIVFHTLNGPLTIDFYADPFGAGVYTFDANGGTNNTFSGRYLRWGVEVTDPDKDFEIESGRIGISKSGNGYMFQFENVIARAEDGSAVNLGPVNGNSYGTQFTVVIKNL